MLVKVLHGDSFVTCISVLELDFVVVVKPALDFGDHLVRVNWHPHRALARQNNVEGGAVLPVSDFDCVFLDLLVLQAREDFVLIKLLQLAVLEELKLFE